MFLLSSSAGLIYQLPYLRYTFYDPMLNTFGYTNVQLGTLMSVYGIGSCICYVLGGFLFATIPGYGVALAISFFWAFTTSLIFWPTLINYVRSLGTADEQGRIRPSGRTAGASLYLEPLARTGWVGNNHTFYFTWWMVFAPFTGLFLIKLAYGRTLREVVLLYTGGRGAIETVVVICGLPTGVFLLAMMLSHCRAMRHYKEYDLSEHPTKIE